MQWGIYTNNNLMKFFKRSDEIIWCDGGMHEKIVELIRRNYDIDLCMELLNVDTKEMKSLTLSVPSVSAQINHTIFHK